MYQWVRELWRTKWGKVGVPTVILGAVDWCARFEFVESILQWLFGKKVWVIVSSPWTSPLLVIGGFALIFINHKRAEKMPPESGSSNAIRINWRAVFFAVLAAALVVLVIWNVHLQGDLSSARKDVSHLKTEMVRYVLPRELTKQQTEAFGKYLSSHSQPHEVIIKYILGDEESRSYAEDFSQAFRAGNWLPTVEPIVVTGVTCYPAPDKAPPFVCSSDLQKIQPLEGVSMLSSGPNPPPPSTLEEKIHPSTTVQEIISEAFKVANIQNLDSSYGYSNNPLDKITLAIGLRPRSKLGVLPPNFYERMQREGRSHNDLRDDDF